MTIAVLYYSQLNLTQAIVFFLTLHNCYHLCRVQLNILITKFQIEDLSQQAQMAAIEKFKTPDIQPGMGGETPSTVSQPIQEESEEEGEVSLSVHGSHCL